MSKKIMGIERDDFIKRTIVKMRDGETFRQCEIAKDAHLLYIIERGALYIRNLADLRFAD